MDRYSPGNFGTYRSPSRAEGRYAVKPWHDLRQLLPKRTFEALPTALSAVGFQTAAMGFRPDLGRQELRQSVGRSLAEHARVEIEIAGECKCVCTRDNLERKFGQQIVVGATH